jgi:hypothetical protein
MVDVVTALRPAEKDFYRSERMALLGRGVGQVI